jgi:hypothetical protein
MKFNEEVYLGDGLYASCDGFKVKLRAPRYGEDGDHEVYLEPEVLKAFEQYISDLRRALKAHVGNVEGEQ